MPHLLPPPPLSPTSLPPPLSPGAAIIEQLVVNGVDNDGLLYPLREWLLDHTQCCNNTNSLTGGGGGGRQQPISSRSQQQVPQEDVFSLTAGGGASGLPCEVTVAELLQLLKDFSVMYRPEEIAELVTEMGVFPSTVVKPRNRSQTLQDTFADSVFAQVLPLFLLPSFLLHPPPPTHTPFSHPFPSYLPSFFLPLTVHRTLITLM